MKVLEVENLRKSLSGREIIKGINFSVEEGEIFGFLGPNGAGKTTTIRMIVGLIAPNSGTIKIMGKDIKENREEALSALGAVVESPELYGYMSGMENLKQIMRVDHRIKQENIDEVVKLVGLENRIKDKVKKYSLGMKQRLGIATALLSNPQILILDEPTNGLDPSGIKEFRELMKKLSKERQMAVFVSSHLLSEVQLLCDTVAFLNHGEIISVESVDSSLAAVGVEENEEKIILKAENIDSLQVILKDLDYVKSVTVNEELITLVIVKDSTPTLIRDLVGRNVSIHEVYKKHQALEDRYVEIVEGGIQ